MDKQEVISKTEEYVKSKLLGESSGHDWWHVYRVWKLAKEITEKEKADLFIVELAALLHDIADWKSSGREDFGAGVAEEFLKGLNLDKKITNEVYDIIKSVSFKGAGVTSIPNSKEGKIVQDADRLDALGAIGIARTFAYGGHKGNEIYNPDIKPKKHESFEEYKTNKSTTINHFYEKLLLLKDLMNTKTGKKMAEERHEFMKQFLDRFFNEWEGKE